MKKVVCLLAVGLLVGITSHVATASPVNDVGKYAVSKMEKNDVFTAPEMKLTDVYEFSDLQTVVTAPEVNVYDLNVTSAPVTSKEEFAERIRGLSISHSPFKLKTEKLICNKCSLYLSWRNRDNGYAAGIDPDKRC